MTKRMLIDATRSQERRVAILDDNKIADFEFETTHKKSSKGNIYLAKVVRVEPSLQAAFVDYGAERHGFLAFSDIHYSYYQIPVSDRESLEQEKQKLLEKHKQESDDLMLVDEEDDCVEQPQDFVDETAGDITPEEDYEIETFGGQVEAETASQSKKAPVFRIKDFYRRYRIQEVIKRGQVILVQVVKDERGNKGAALTTYVSLPGRYCVLMPNAFHNGGVSRKISDIKDRRRIRKILESLELPDNTSLIVRTAGKDRSKIEIKRDYEYLIRLWDEIRDKALNSMAPTVVYEEANIVRQAVRDLYRKEIEEILVEGKEAYADAKKYIKQLLPSHSKRVKLYSGEESLFQKFAVDAQLEDLYRSRVVLPSGGYIIINQTEALVSIDINSGKATKERNISETAYKTNLEAAMEIARQLRLRNLAGLIVIDFIDMDHSKHIGAVERRLREAMRDDRARIQIGHISQFGLLELSRQRLGVSYHETITQVCPQCEGHGHIPANHMLALKALRQIQVLGMRKSSNPLVIRLNPSVALCLLNDYRNELTELERKLEKKILVETDPLLSVDDIALPNQRAISLEIKDVERRPEKRELKRHNRFNRQNQRQRRQESIEPVEPSEGQEAVVDIKETTEPHQQKRRLRRRKRHKEIRSQDQQDNVLQLSDHVEEQEGSLASNASQEENQEEKQEEFSPKKSRRRWWKRNAE